MVVWSYNFLRRFSFMYSDVLPLITLPLIQVLSRIYLRYCTSNSGADSYNDSLSVSFPKMDEDP